MKLCEDLPDEKVLCVRSIEPWIGELGSNNITRYQVLNIGLQMTLEIEITYMEVYGDSMLIINQLSHQYDVKHEDLKPYFIYARRILNKFEGIMVLEHILG